MIIVPNSLLSSGSGFQTALPDYRVLVIGAERYVGHGGTSYRAQTNPRSAPPNGGCSRPVARTW